MSCLAATSGEWGCSGWPQLLSELCWSACPKGLACKTCWAQYRYAGQPDCRVCRLPSHLGHPVHSTYQTAFPIPASPPPAPSYPSDDINKFLWMVRIGGGVFPDIKESNYLSSDGALLAASQRAECCRMLPGSYAQRCPGPAALVACCPSERRCAPTPQLPANRTGSALPALPRRQLPRGRQGGQGAARLADVEVSGRTGCASHGCRLRGHGCRLLALLSAWIAALPPTRPPVAHLTVALPPPALQAVLLPLRRHLPHVWRAPRLRPRAQRRHRPPRLPVSAGVDGQGVGLWA